jgi:membrane-associated phospholipid phosphatase
MSPMPDEPEVPPQVAPPASRLASRLEPDAAAGARGRGRILHELGQLDLAVYRAIAITPTPTLDEPMRRLSQLADNSKIWIGAAAALAVIGGSTGRRVAATGVAALAVNSLIVNLPLKRAARRARPDRDAAMVPLARHVAMPLSPSFPSGHAASGFAFAAAVGGAMPVAAAPLRLVASAVAYTRVHTGVHYPGDVLIGALIGTTIGEGATVVSRWLDRARSEDSARP